MLLGPVVMRVAWDVKVLEDAVVSCPTIAPVEVRGFAKLDGLGITVGVDRPISPALPIVGD